MARETTVGVALLLVAWSAVFGQQPPPAQNESQRLIEAVREGNEAALIELIKTSAGRQELLALSDMYVFEIRVAKLLASSLPESPEDRRAVRQSELSLLRQTSDEAVVKELFVGLLAHEPKDVTDPAVAIKLADALFNDIQKDLNDELTRDGKAVSGGKSRVMVEIAESIIKTVAEPAQKAFFNRILSRVRAEPDPDGMAIGEPAFHEAAPPQEKSARRVFWEKILSGAAMLLLVLLVAATGWRITTFRKGRVTEPQAATIPADLPELDQDESSQP